LTNVPSPRLEAAVESVLAADGLIAVTPIFNGSYSGIFKLFFDALDRDALHGMPVLIGATAGTPRHSLALDHAMRPMFAYLNALVVPTAVFAATEDWGRVDLPADAGLADRIARAGSDLAGAMATRDRTVRRDEFADPIPFDELLRASGPE
jgi:FMN reductase